MKVNLDKPLLDLNDQPLGDETMAKVLANILKTAQTNEPIKVLSWALDFFKTGEADLSPSEAEEVKNMVKSNAQFIALVKGRILSELEAQTAKPK